MKPRVAAELRLAMVSRQLEARGISDPAVLSAMRVVPRHLFVRPADQDQAYDDYPINIGEGQTISQPYVVAATLEALRLSPGAKVLEVGGGSGYQAAVAAEMGARVITLEILPRLAEFARANLAAAGYSGVQVYCADGWKGWPDEAPYDAVMLAAAAPAIPPALWQQLADGGRLVLPLGDQVQMLTLYEKRGQERIETRLFPVRYVPMTGGTA